MRSVSVFVVVLSAFVLSACQKGESNSVDERGNCTFQFVTDFNNVAYAAQSLSYETSATDRYYEKVQTLKNACDALYARHSGVSCRAEVRYKGQQISANDKKPACDAAASTLEQRATQAPTAYPSGSWDRSRL